ncbi:hypothetical protein ASE43_02150 [Lysobacter sp. Root983]|nr:hypothetical protein ASE43_02150 [Lysobacter sp. Root983]
MPLLEVAKALRELSLLGVITGIGVNGRPVRMVKWVGTEPSRQVCPQEVEWREILEGLGDKLSEADRASLGSSFSTFNGLDRCDKIAIIEGMIAMRDGIRCADTWVWSAENLLGSSKAARSLRTDLGGLGVNVDDSGGLYYAITAGPSTPEAVVLIENPRVFSAVATSAQASRILAVAAYGYGLTIDNFGQRLLAGQVVSCPAVGERADLRWALTQLPAYFWGDLDLEGLRIYESLKQRLPSIRLSAAYSAMDRMLDDRRRSHPYHRLFEKDRQGIPPSGNEADVAYLAKRCLQRAVDQEAVVRIVDQINLTMPFER